MERVAFLIEKTGERVPCLLNPASIIMRRTAGVRPRSSSTGPLTGAGMADDPLLYTGGGVTEIILDLLFDVSLVTEPDVVENVQDLTRPLTTLTEGDPDEDGPRIVPLIRLIWGKAWNVLGVVAAIAERLENFTPSGAPQRSWLRMRMLRINDNVTPEGSNALGLTSVEAIPDINSLSLENGSSYQVRGEGDDADGTRYSERLDEIATQKFGDPSWWKLIATFNNIDNPWDITPGRVLMVPPATTTPGDLA